MRNRRWHSAALLLAVLGVAALVRVWLARHSEVISPRDGMAYMAAAQAWSDDPSEAVRTTVLHIGYPAATAAMRRCLYGPAPVEEVSQWQRAGRLVSLLASLAATVALWWFAAMAFDTRVAFVGCLLFSATRRWSVLGVEALSDALAICMQLWAAAFALYAAGWLLRGRWRAVLFAAVAGLFVGAGYLVRLDSLYALAAIVVLLTACALRRRGRWQIALASTAAAAFAAAGAGAPYALAIRGITKKKTLDEFVRRPLGPHVLAGCVAQAPARSDVPPRRTPQGGARPQASEFYPPLALAAAGTSRYAPPHKYVNRFFEAMHPILATLLCLWLATWIGVRALRLKLPRRVHIFPTFAAGAFMLAAAVFLSGPVLAHYHQTGSLSHRYLMPLAAVLSPLSGAAVLILAQWAQLACERLFRRPLHAGWFAAILVAGLLAGLAVHTLRPVHVTKGYFRDAAEFTRAAGGSEEVVLSDSAYVRHYARGPAWPLTHSFLADPNLLLGYLRVRGASLLTLREDSVRECNPSLWKVLRPPIFREIQVFSRKGGGDAIHVYRVALPQRSPGRDVVANDDEVRARPDAATTTPNLLANDHDPQGGPLQVVGIGRAKHGTVTYAGRGRFTYRPRRGYRGRDSFTYTLTGRSGVRDVARVTVLVGP